MPESCNPFAKQVEWGSVILVHQLVINASNIHTVVEKTSKQNTINSQEANFLSQFLCSKLAHTWRYMCVILPSFPAGFTHDKAQINILYNTTLSVPAAWRIRGISFPCNSTEGWSRSLLLTVGWVPCLVPPGTSHALPSTCLEGVWEGGQAACCSLGDVPSRSQEMSSPPSLTQCHPPLPVALGLGSTTWTSEGRGLCSEDEAAGRIWLSSAE